MKLTITHLVLCVVLAVLVAGFTLYMVVPGLAFGSAPPGTPSTQRTATTTEVGPQQTKTLFAANAFCASRIIRTQGEPVYISFADPTNGDVASTTLAWNVGFFQAASTTVAYDSGLYGCGRMTVKALASTTITSAETI